jgi:ABC-type branched-subunit amino acid transport system ATPase component
VALLKVENLSVSFKGNRALSGLNLEAAEGTVVGLVGANGAGKTTALDAITGFVDSTGSVRFDGHELSKRPAHARAQAGLSRTWQGTQLFEDLSVKENLLVGVPGHSMRDTLASFSRRFREAAVAELARQLAALGLEVDSLLGRPASDLSQGERKVVGLCRALAARPRMLFADEPAAGLDSDESKDLGAVLRRLAARGITTLLVDHDMGLVLTACDYIYVLDHGLLIAQDTPDEIRRNPDVLASYLGSAGPHLDGHPPSELSTEGTS